MNFFLALKKIFLAIFTFLIAAYPAHPQKVSSTGNEEELLSTSISYKGPVIDMHVHVYEELPPEIRASWAADQEAQNFVSPQTAEEHLALVLQEMTKNNIVLAVGSGNTLKAVKHFKKAAPGRSIGGITSGLEGALPFDLDSLERLRKQGVIEVLGEMGLQYAGVKPDDPRLAPYFELAEKNHMPVCLHTGLGPPGAPFSFAPKFRTTLGKPTLLEPVLVKYPNLKIYMAHAGWPYISETIAMMYIYPNLYADISILAWGLPKEAFYSALKELINAGFEKRLMFGSDQMMWPEGISKSINTINAANFLSREQKKYIFYDNAARFLELDEEEIARHHQQVFED